jgi:hypothetical protein
MKLTTVSAAVAAIFVFSQTAHARDHHYRHGARHEAWRHVFVRHHLAQVRSDRFERAQHLSRRSKSGRSQRRSYAYEQPPRYNDALGPRPAAWCGWEMRRLVSSDPGPAYNLARNWARWGHAGPAGVGAVVVWPHHVGKIVGQLGGMWVIESGNDGHRLRTRPRSITGVIAIRWG